LFYTEEGILAASKILKPGKREYRFSLWHKEQEILWGDSLTFGDFGHHKKLKCLRRSVEERSK
jgi:hypothetical protein